jgi:two-component system chemotaxis response regulator CheB
MVPDFPPDFDLPVFIIQQMESVFTHSLADYLADMSKLPVREARNGEQAHGGTIYLAPSSRHMLLRKTASGLTIEINDDPPVNFSKPSIDVFFRSVAESVDNGVISVILSGMGKDGITGIKELKEQGCVCLVLDKESSPIYGLPESIIGSGCSDEILPDAEIGKRIVALVQEYNR